MNVGMLSLADGSEISSASIGTEVVTNPDGRVRLRRRARQEM